MTEQRKRGRPPAINAIKSGAYTAYERGGVWIIKHGDNVRVVMPTRETAQEYIDWVSK